MATRSDLVPRGVWGGALGPPIFVGAWVAGTIASDPGYSAVDDAISRLAASGASTWPILTGGLVGYGVAMGAFSAALRAAGERTWPIVAVNAVTTFGVAATPLDHSPALDRAHGVFAFLGYASLVAVPLVARRGLGRRGPRSEAPATRRSVLAATAMPAALVATAALVASIVDPDANGLWQRVGLTTVDAWIVGWAWSLGRGRSTR